MESVMRQVTETNLNKLCQKELKESSEAIHKDNP